MEPLKIEFTLDGNAYTRLMQRIFTKKALVWGAIGLVFVAINAAINPSNGLVWLFSYLLFAVVWYFIFRLILQRTYKAATNLHDSVQYVFGETEIHVSNANSETTHQWSAFQKAVEMPEWFLLYQNKTVFNPLPKSAFGSETALQQFRNLLKMKGLLAP